MRTPSGFDRDFDIGMREGQGMAQRNQVGCLLGCHDSGDARHSERIALGIIRQRIEHFAAHAHERMRASRAAGGVLFADIHHARLARRIEM